MKIISGGNNWQQMTNKTEGYIYIKQFDPRCYVHTYDFQNIFSETAWPMKAKFYVDPTREGRRGESLRK